MKKMPICRKVSIKEIAEACEKSSLYPEENCGQPATYLECEVKPDEELTEELEKRAYRVGM
jgi:hypothetical protein